MKAVFINLQSLISGYLPFALLIICGIYLTLNGRFFQFSKFKDSLKLSKKAFKGSKLKCEGISSFQAACTALSGTVGTGNIVGVAGAISLGGPGAVFWMIFSSFLGMAVKYIEITLSVKHRIENNKSFSGGPMYYIKNGLGNRFSLIAFLYCFALMAAVFCMGNITQTNSAILFLTQKARLKIFLGVIFSLLTALVVLGGSKRICKFTERIVPIMSAVYIALCFGVIIAKIEALPSAVLSIIKGAFLPKSVTGGIVGSTLSCFITGAARGVFSNEAGLGTSAMAHAVAFDANEETQGFYGIIEVFVDTVLICSFTALTILCSGVNIDYGNVSGTALVKDAFSAIYGNVSDILLSVMMFVFAFSSIIGWALYGEIGSEFLFGKLGSKIFLFVYPLVCVLGAVCSEVFAWQFSEFFNGCLLCINLPVLLLLSDDILQRLRGNGFVRTKIGKNSTDFR